MDDHELFVEKLKKFERKIRKHEKNVGKNNNIDFITIGNELIEIYDKKPCKHCISILNDNVPEGHCDDYIDNNE